uniref:Ovule protein n=1 Tax=Angiostrongylus cantonensis TaxID=6313 RepID=A0A0K0D6H1_ANGCA
LAKPPSPSSVSGEKFVDIPLSNIRATIARRLTQSKVCLSPHHFVFVIGGFLLVFLYFMAKGKEGIRNQKVRRALNSIV